MNICIVDRGGSIPVVKYGGTERVIWGLGKELHRLGHNVTFLVPKGSSSDFAKVLEYNPEVPVAEQIPTGIDMVHLNFAPEQPLSLPYLITMHGNPKPDETIDLNTVFISKNQAERFNSTVFVYNGLSWEDYPTPDLGLKRKGFHFLGKASWKIKNAIGAMKIASAVNEELHVLGGKKWTERNIKSGFKYLFNGKIKFHGLVDDFSKMKIMQQSKGLIFPVLWHEPFGLAIIESLYAGCAVFGSKNGSLEELIGPEIGFTANSTEELSKAIINFGYNPQKCHNYAVEFFNSKKMALEYLKLYEKRMNGENLHGTAPSFNQNLNQVPNFS